MNIKIDQSGKIEDLRQNTIITLRNKEQYTVLLKRKLKNHLWRLTCSLKSLTKRLKLSARCLWSVVRYLWSDIKCLRSDTKVANIKPIVNTAPILKTNREIIMSSTDQEPLRINLMSWYATKTLRNQRFLGYQKCFAFFSIPKITRRITATFTMYSAVLFSAFILTTNQPFDQPYNKKYDYNCNNSKHPINWFLFHNTTEKIHNIKTFLSFIKVTVSVLNKKCGLK